MLTTKNVGAERSPTAPPGPDAVFEQLTDMFGDVADSSVILDVGTRMAWNLEQCIERMIEISGEGPSSTSSIDAPTSGASLNVMPNMFNPPPQLPATFEVSHWNPSYTTPLAPMPVQGNVNTTCTGAIPKVPSSGASTFQHHNNHVGNINNNNNSSKNINHNLLAQNTSATFMPSSSSLFQSPAAQSSGYAAPPDYAECLDLCRAGHRVLICMRGAPGSGKSHLAQQLIAEAVPQSNARHHIFSADNYFMRRNGRYEYNPGDLPAAHAMCRKAVAERAAAGWSPLCVDNTNMQTWEMHEYMGVAANNGYIVRLLESNVPWRLSAGQLAQRNQHGVPKEKIAQMLMRYQPISVEQLLAECRLAHHVNAVPQPRLMPPPPPPPLGEQPNTLIDLGMDTFRPDSMAFKWQLPAQTMAGSVSEPAQQQQLQGIRTLQPPQQPLQPPPGNLDTFKLAAQQLQRVNEQLTAYEVGRQTIDTPAKLRSTVVNSPTMKKAADAAKCSLIDLLRSTDNNDTIAVTTTTETTTVAADDRLAKHRPGCRNENTAFVGIRNIFPSVAATTLWDLFEQCAGDAEWTMDILLKEETRVQDYNDAPLAARTPLQCNCDRPAPVDDVPIVNGGGSGASLPSTPSRPMSRRERTAAAQNDELRRHIEDSVRIGDQHYSSHARNIRDYRRGVQKPVSTSLATDQSETETTDTDCLPLDGDTASSVPSDSELGAAALAAATAAMEAAKAEARRADIDSDGDEAAGGGSDEAAGSDDDDGNETIEVNLGMELVGQLESSFGMNIFPGAEPPLTSVFMPKRMARELYALWIESVYNQQDEQRERAMLEDEEFALQLQAQQQKELDDLASEMAAVALAAAPASPLAAGGAEGAAAAVSPVHNKVRSNMKQIVEMECAWAEYQRQQTPNQWTKPNGGLAAEMTQQKLNELFPNIDAETLADVFRLSNHDFHRTVEQLSQMRSEGLASDERRQHTQELMERAKMEAEKLTVAADRVFAPVGDAEKPVGNPEEAKRVAMRNFEDCRNLAKHHTQMRTECYRKAKQAIQSGSTEVAVYYSRVANLHKNKLDRCNQHAANCIVEVHNLTNNNPDMLDLHYLYVREAVEWLDLFLDQHVSRIRASHQPRKSVMVITGRGLHSVRGYSTVKQATKNRLRERGLSWTEINPGLLRIRIYPTTALSMDF